ncbi:MAG: sensor histidine kinase [Gemmatirosa sp.]
MGSVLAIVLGAALVLTHVTLTRFAVETAEERLSRAVRQLARVSADGIRRGARRYLDVAGDPAVRAALRSPPSSAGLGDTTVRQVLARLATPADSGTPTELWTADGRRIAVVGDDLRGEPRVAPEADALPVPHQGLAAVAPDDSVGLGSLYASGGRVFYWVVVPIREGGRPIGYLAHQRRIAGTPQTEQTIRELTGDSVTTYYRNADGGLWSTLAGVPVAAPRRDSTAAGVVAHRPGAGPMLTAEARVRGTSLDLVVELPRARVTARPRAAVVTLAGISVVLLGVGAVLTWAVSRRITRPIASLTGAAEALARGDYDARATARGSDEVARLAESFNRMAREIAVAHGALERQSAEARATADLLTRSNEELRLAREAAEAANRAKSDFLATMSHELRTPLNAIGGYTELIEMGLRGPVTDEQRRDLERIRLSQQHLLGLISAILDRSRIERGLVSYQLGTIAIDPLLGSLDALVGPQAAAQELVLSHVSGDQPLAVRADREKLRQVLLNLLSNAIRCTPPGGRVTLTARARDASCVEIRVEDTGIGIPPEKLEAIFEPFVQLDRSLSQVRDGIGLGLAISRDLTRGMEGDLTVASRVGQGSCFMLTLPRAELTGADAPMTSEETPAASAFAT